MNLTDLLSEIQVDPKFVEGRTPTDRMCEGCGVCRADHVHHTEFKKMGGRKGAEKQRIDAPEKKKALCIVCHGASHRLYVISPSSPRHPNGFSCGVCPRRFQCLYGARLLGLPTEGLTPPW